MKRLLLLPLLCLMPAAHAMDYVKCEAMQNAIYRVTSAKAKASSKAGLAEASRQIKEQCGAKQELPLKRPETCDNGIKVVLDFSRVNQARKEAEAMNDIRLSKIKADYEADGCF